VDYPKLRSIEAIPVSTSSGQMIYLKDPEGYCINQVVVSRGAFFIISYFDGKHSIRDIQTEYVRQFGNILLSDKIKELIEQMDNNFLLENENFLKHKKEREEEFKSCEIRFPACAGSVYPKEKDELRKLIGEILEKGKKIELPSPLKGLIAPHIDYDRGENCYGTSYRSLEERDIDLFVIFGTSHRGGRNFFILTEKDFETPLGRIKTDRDSIRMVQDLCNFDLFEEEFLHKQEHSIELQLPFIQYLFEDFEIIPVLCTGYGEKIKDGKEPKDSEEFSAFVKAIQTVIKESNKKVCFIAGADFSHTGFTFGDNFPLTESVMSNIKKKDLESISFIKKMDPGGFYRSVKEDEDFRKICGLPPIYTLMSVLERGEGKLLSYDRWVDYDIQSTVTFAGIGVE